MHLCLQQRKLSRLACCQFILLINESSRLPFCDDIDLASFDTTDNQNLTDIIGIDNGITSRRYLTEPTNIAEDHLTFAFGIIILFATAVCCTMVVSRLSKPRRRQLTSVEFTIWIRCGKKLNRTSYNMDNNKNSNPINRSKYIRDNGLLALVREGLRVFARTNSSQESTHYATHLVERLNCGREHHQQLTSPAVIYDLNVINDVLLPAIALAPPSYRNVTTSTISNSYYCDRCSSQSSYSHSQKCTYPPPVYNETTTVNSERYPLVETMNHG